MFGGGTFDKMIEVYCKGKGEVGGGGWREEKDRLKYRHAPRHITS